MQPGVGPKMGVRETWGVGSRGEPLGYMPLVNLIALSEPVSSAEEVGVKIPAAGESGHGQPSKYSDPLLHRSGSPWGPQSLLIWLLVLIFFCLSLALHASSLLLNSLPSSTFITSASHGGPHLPRSSPH